MHTTFHAIHAYSQTLGEKGPNFLNQQKETRWPRLKYFLLSKNERSKIALYFQLIIISIKILRKRTRTGLSKKRKRGSGTFDVHFSPPGCRNSKSESFVYVSGVLGWTGNSSMLCGAASYTTMLAHYRRKQMFPT